MAGVAGLSEFALVRVAVAIGAVLELDAFIARLAVRAIGVAVLAADVAMLAGEREAGGLMLIDGVVGCLEGRALMAALAAIEPWGRSELAPVHILVAVRAARKIQLEAGIFAGGRVATGAGHTLMLEDDGEASLRMLRDCEG